jgi:hypothetical protein
MHYRIQLEMLAIVTATLLKYRQYHYENLSSIVKEFLSMLTSNRRELRHGALECFTVICSYFNSYKPITSNLFDTNSSIRVLFSSIDSLSLDASNALRFRLQRNLLPSLTDEGNITPGLVCDSSTVNDPDAKFILLVNNPMSTPQPTKSNEKSMTISSAPTTTTLSNSHKLLQLAMPFAATTTKSNALENVC